MLKKLLLIGGYLMLVHSSIFGQQNIDSLLNVLDKKIEERNLYIAVKNAKIETLKNLLKKSNTVSQQAYNLNKQLYQEYQKYRFDSALHYVYTCLDLAKSLQRKDWLLRSKLDLAAILTATGMPHQSIETLQSIQKSDLTPQFSWDYYNDFKQAYQKLHEYTLDEHYAPHYKIKAEAYHDSILQSVPFTSNEYLLEAGFGAFERGELEEAERMYWTLCEERLEFGTPSYAIAASTLANIYAAQNRVDLQEKYLILSAISDIQAVIKENASLTNLAILLYQEGEIQRADKYIEYALEDANFYNARLRKIEISEVYPIINNAYQLQIEKQKSELQYAVIGITAISILLLIALRYIYVQMQKLTKARKNLHSLNQELEEANGRLNNLNQTLQLTNNQLHESNQQLNELNSHTQELNQELQKSNQQLNSLNRELQEANYIKEEYIGHFMNQCSAYIDKLENYRKIVRNKVLTKRYNDLIKLTEPTASLKSELKEFYGNFDNAFLRLYPNFVEKFNALLIQDKQVSPKKGERLSTELRIFALIRLGISDSYKIANFLRYSVNTIYNYRAKIKNKSAVDRGRFEEYVMDIGAL